VCNCVRSGGKQGSAEVRLSEFKRSMPFDAVEIDGPEHGSVVAKRAYARMMELNGCPYTEIDAGGTSVEYWRGFHSVNRTGRFFILPGRYDDWQKEIAKKEG
jgi:hypothetical protein